MDAREFEQVIADFSDDLYRFALSLARNGDDACDLVQQAFVIFAEKGHTIREQSKRKNWLFTALYREFLGTRNKDKRRVCLEEPEWEAVADPAPADARRQAEYGEALAALADLEDSQRAILSLFYLEQHSYKEIAEILGIPAGTVMSRLSRAKEALRERMDNGGGEGIKIIPFPSDDKEKHS